MEKKTYLSPFIIITKVETVGFFCKSGVQNNDIPYGGIDDNGTLVPGSRRQNDMWYDEEDEEEEEDF